MIRQRGLGGLGVMIILLVIISVYTIIARWFEMEQLKASHRNYQQIAESQTQILKSLARYFAVDCADDGYVTPVTVTKLIEDGYLPIELLHNPYEFSYSLTINRATASLDPITGRTIVDGRSVMELTTTAEQEHLDGLSTAYRSKDLHFTHSGSNLILHLDNPISDVQLEQDYLLGGASGSFYCR